MDESTKGSRAVIYERVSTDSQRDNYTPAERVQGCLKLIKEQGFLLVGERYVDPRTAYDCEPDVDTAIPAYVDDHTSLEWSRPRLDEVFDYARRAEFEIMVVHHIDRLSRDPYLREGIERELGRLGIRVEYVTGRYETTPQGQLRKRFDSVLAEYDNLIRAERCTMGLIGKAKRGLFVMGRPPYGYIVDPNAPGGLRVNEVEAAIVLRIYVIYAYENMSLRAIQVKLNEEGIPTPKGGKRWWTASIRVILRDPAYVGCAYYNKTYKSRSKGTMGNRDESEWIPIAVPPIVDEHIFALVQEKLDRNRTARRCRSDRDYLLTGMMVCGNCGHNYGANTRSPRPPDHRYKEPYTTYRHSRLNRDQCRCRCLSAKKLENEVWAVVIDLLEHPERLRDWYEIDVEKRHNTQLLRRAQLEAVIEAEHKLHQKIENLDALFIDPDVDLPRGDYLARRERLLNELRTACTKRQEIEAVLGSTINEETWEAFLRRATAIRDYLHGEEELSQEEKRKILEMLSAKVVIEEDGTIWLHGWFGEPRQVVRLSSSERFRCACTGTETRAYAPRSRTQPAQTLCPYTRASPSGSFHIPHCSALY